MKIFTKQLATILCVMSYMVIRADAQAGVSDKCLNAIMSVKSGVDIDQIYKCIDLSNSINKESICNSDCENFTLPESFDYACTSNQDKQMTKKIITGIQQINKLRKQNCPNTNTNTSSENKTGMGYYPQSSQSTNNNRAYPQPSYVPYRVYNVSESYSYSTSGNINTKSNISMFLSAAVIVALNLFLY